MQAAYENLANAIIEQAVKDFRAARQSLRRHPDDEKAKDRIKEVEMFFHSGWCKALTDVDPDYILERLRKEVF